MVAAIAGCSHGTRAQAPAQEDPCRGELLAAERRFLHRAPGAFRPYRDRWDDAAGTVHDDSDMYVRVLSPGRSWFFVVALTHPDRLAAGEIPRIGFRASAGPSWRTHPSEEGVGRSRTVHDRAAALWVSSERAGDDDIANHPLTRLFFAVYQPAVERCAGLRPR